jgi:hypothetical protein
VAVRIATFRSSFWVGIERKQYRWFAWNSQRVSRLLFLEADSWSQTNVLGAEVWWGPEFVFCAAIELSAPWLPCIYPTYMTYFDVNV